MPTIDPLYAENIAREYFGIDCRAQKLDGYEDHNFRLVSHAGLSHVLKISQDNQNLHLLQLQHEAMRHCHAHGFEFTPLPIRASSGEEVVSLQVEGGSYHCRLLTWLDGQMVSHFLCDRYHLEHSIGRFLGCMDKAMESFEFRPVKRDSDWDLPNALNNERLLSSVKNADELALLKAAFSSFRENSYPKLTELRFAHIHNDANEFNLLVESESNLTVCGILDFGDMTYSPLIANLSIAAAYMLMEKSEPGDRLPLLVRAYTEVMPMTELELSLLHNLIATRLAVSITQSTHQSRLNPENRYILQSRKPALDLLSKWLRLDAGKLTTERVKLAAK